VDDLPINSPHLASNWPNPFNPKTHISFNLPAAGSARLDILSVDGRLINTLLSGELAAGEHRVTWSGRDLADHPVASGIYLYRLSASDWSETKTMVLLK
jgi:flagellar hook assembly protein FlgD